MAHALFDPEVFFASDDIWSEANRKNVFLTDLDNHLEFINSIGIVDILWCDEYDARLWSMQQPPPWQKTKEWNLRISQMLYTHLAKHSYRIDISQLMRGECNPQIECCCSIARDEFLKLVSAA